MSIITARHQQDEKDALIKFQQAEKDTLEFLHTEKLATGESIVMAQNTLIKPL